MSVLKSAVLFLAFAYYTQAQEGMCEMITVEDLIDSPDGGLTPGLLVRTYTTNLRPTNPSIRLEDFKVVCLAAGSKRDTYRFVSIVVEQRCRGSLCPDDHNDEIKLVQYDFECDPNTNTWSTDVLGDTDNVRVDEPIADLDTELRTNCSVCAAKNLGSDSINHCRDCEVDCNVGAMLCGRFAECCNYYNDDKCVEECPDDKVADPNNFTCVVPKECPGLENPSNGNVDIDSEEDERVYPAKAIYSCNTGYDLDGVKSRQCQINGKWDEEEPSCERSGIDCGLLTGPENGEVSFSNTTSSSVATYSCDSGYALIGDNTRTCLDTGLWSGSAPTCGTPTNGEKSLVVVVAVLLFSILCMECL